MHEGAQTQASRGRFKTAQAVVAALLIVGLLTAIFIIQNSNLAKVHFLFWSGSIPLAGALLLAAALGGICAFLVVFVRQRFIARESREQDRSARESRE